MQSSSLLVLLLTAAAAAVAAASPSEIPSTVPSAWPSPTTPQTVCQELTTAEKTIVDEDQVFEAELIEAEYQSSVEIPQGTSVATFTVTASASVSPLPTLVYWLNGKSYEVSSGTNDFTAVVEGVTVKVGKETLDNGGQGSTRVVEIQLPTAPDSLLFGVERNGASGGAIQLQLSIVVECQQVPTDAPTVSPTTAAPSTPVRNYMEALRISNVRGDSWTEVSLQAPFFVPIAVCTVHYNASSLLLLEKPPPTVVRLRRLGPDGFHIRLQQPGQTSVAVSREVHCLVVEQGAHRTAQGGHRIEAQSYGSTVTDFKDHWQGEKRRYLQSYQRPVVLGQVLTSIDSRWSVFWCHGGRRKNAPNRTHVFTGKQVGEDMDVVRQEERVGFVVMETGAAASAGFQADRGPSRVKGVGNWPVDGPYTYATQLPAEENEAAAAVVVADMAGMNGLDGGWAAAVADNNALLSFVIDEDQLGDPDRKHNKEKVGYFAFQTAGVFELLEA